MLSRKVIAFEQRHTAEAALLHSWGGSEMLPRRLMRAVNAVKGLFEVSECYCNALNHGNGQHTRLCCFMGMRHCTADLIANENKQRLQR